MDSWSCSFATTGAELDVQDALLALERVLGRQGLSGALRVRLEEAASALREIQSAAAAAAESPFGAPDSEDWSQPA